MAKQPLSIVRGTTNSFSVAITDVETGEAYELEAGEILRFGVKKSATDPECIFEKAVTDADENDEYVFTIEVSDTSALPFGMYSYDVGLQSGNAYYPIISASDFAILKNITAWEAAT